MNRKRAGLCGLAAVVLTLGDFPGAGASEQAGSISGKLKSHWLEKGHELVVYVEEAKGTFPAPQKPRVMNQINLVYVPHILPIVAGWQVEFQSRDDVLHNLLGRFKTWLQKVTRQIFNLAMPPRSKPVLKTFEKPGLVTLLCSIHSEMSAYILVLQNPYFAQVGKEGIFRIEGVSPGRYTLKVWGEKLSPESLAKSYLVTVEAGKPAELAITP